MSPELATIDQVLDDDELFNMIRNDLAQRHPKALTAGRKSTPVEVILRMLAIKQLYDLLLAGGAILVLGLLVLGGWLTVKAGRRLLARRQSYEVSKTS